MAATILPLFYSLVELGTKKKKGKYGIAETWRLSSTWLEIFA